MGTHTEHILQNWALYGFKTGHNDMIRDQTQMNSNKIAFSIIITSQTSLYEVSTIQWDIFKKQYSLEL